jgi:mono/diheme cytochrome c family protein
MLKVRNPNAGPLAVFCVVLATIGLVLAVSFNSAQEKNIKTVPIKFTDPSSAKDMYTEYCAVCHGTDAKGNGSAASEFKHPPTDLTTLAKKNSGKFPEEEVYATLKFGTNAPAHGTLQMPIWAGLFRAIDQQSSSIPQLRMNNLVEYIRTIQTK